MTDQGLQKAYLEDKETGERITCRFNPKEYTIAKSATWNRTPARGAQSASTAEFVGTNPRSLQLQLFFDGWDSGSGDVSKDVDTLLGWTNPTSKSISENKPNPPIVVFHWGSKSYFDAYVKSVSAQYSMFLGDGTPVRANVSVSFEEVPAEPAGQNPTSGGMVGKRTHSVGAGDTLHSIAYAEYGNSTLWRGLAAFNSIDDPLRLDSGTSLLIPPASQAAKQS